MRYKLEELDIMEGHEFEYAVADLLRHNGWRDVEVTQGSGDYGIDILARRKSTKYAIQCKRYKSAVGVKAVQEAGLGTDYYHCDAAAVITNCRFTKNAENLASTTGVKLWDRDFLEKLIEGYEDEYDELDPKAALAGIREKPNVPVSNTNRVCPKCRREFLSKSVKCPICGVGLVSAAEASVQKASSTNGLAHSANGTENIKWNAACEQFYESTRTAFLLCLFLGVLGVHRFYQNKIGTGILWLFTCGGFFLGWIVDLINLGMLLNRVSNQRRTADK